jgi:PLP dependent protein
MLSGKQGLYWNRQDKLMSLLSVKHLIAEYEKKYGRQENSVRLLIVCKGQSIEKIIPFIAAGQRLFGESYVKEALLKMEALKETKDIEWHFIGPLQSNKTKKIAEHFSWVHSVDSKRMAKRLNDQRPLSMPLLKVCIEVNVSGEVTKSGISKEEVLELAAFCLTLPRLQLRGLMAIPAKRETLAEQRDQYRQLAALAKILNAHFSKKNILLDTLSMGMSQDMEAAIAEGSTLVRIGQAVFN